MAKAPSAGTYERFRLWITPPKAVGSLLMLVFILRNCFAAALVPGWMGTLGVLSYVFLTGAAIYAFSTSFRLAAMTLPVLIGWLPGSLMSASSETSISKYAGWALLVLAAGPLIKSLAARHIRLAAWQVLVISTMVIGCGSFLWYLLGLPVYGRGDFTGLMNHANTVGPLASIGVIGATCKAFHADHSNRWKWVFVAVACALTVVVAGSRASLYGLVVAMLVICLVEWRKVIGHLVYFVPFVILITVGGFGMVSRMDSFEKMTQTLSKKEGIISREMLWDARMNEFRSKPLWGIGVGHAEGGEFEGVFVDPDGNINVEPGSSWLALLSMTGLAGTLTFSLMLGWILWMWFAQYKIIPVALSAQLLGVQAFMIMHGIAEGWLLAVGSPLCLIYWLNLGRMMDVANATRAKGRKSRHRRRIRRRVPERFTAESPRLPAASA